MLNAHLKKNPIIKGEPFKEHFHLPETDHLAVKKLVSMSSP